MDKEKKQPKNKHKVFQLSLNITEHDMSYRARNVVELLTKGHCTIVLIIKIRGRQVDNIPAKVRDIFDKFISLCEGKVIQDGELSQKENIWQVRLKLFKKGQT